MKGLTILLYFILFGLVGSLIIDFDHLMLFVDHPGLLYEEKLSVDRYWDLTKTYDVHRPIHIPLLVFISVLLLLYSPPVIKYITRNNL